MWPTQIEKSWCSERCVWLLEVYPKSLCPRKKARKNQDHSVLYPHCLGGEYIYIYLSCPVSWTFLSSCSRMHPRHHRGSDLFWWKTNLSPFFIGRFLVVSLVDWARTMGVPKITKLHTIQQLVCRFSIEHYPNKKVTKMEICKWASVFCSGSTKKGGHILCSPWL